MIDEREGDNLRVSEKTYEIPHVRVIYGYIVDMASTPDDNDLYLPLVRIESLGRPIPEAFIPLAQPMEQLTAVYGSPRDLIGRRVRIEYQGSKWFLGRATITSTPGDNIPGGEQQLPSVGFRHAIAGRG